MIKSKNRRSKGTDKQKVKKDSSKAWISLVLALFFWVPLLNIILILPGSIFMGVKAMINAKKKPDKFSGFYLALISVSCASVSFVYAVVILYLNVSGRL